MTDRQGTLVRFSLFAAALGVGVAVAAAELSLWPLVAAAAAPWAALVARARGGIAASAAAIVAVPLALLATAMASHAVGATFGFAVITVSVVFGVAGTVVASTRPLGLPVQRLLFAAPAVTGALVWAAVLAASQVVPGASRLSWVLPGDAVNNVLLSRYVLEIGGVAVGPDENPAPLPHVLLALSMDGGRTGLDASRLLEHDLVALAVLWCILLITLATVFGLVALAVIGAGRPVLAGCAAAGASLLPLSWLYGTFMLEFGFINAAIVLAILAAGIIVTVRSASHPVLSMVVLAGACVLMLATWAPLVLVPGLQLLLVGMMRRRELLRARRGAVGWLAGAGAALGAYVFAVSLPSLLAHRSFLSADGGPIDLNSWLFGIVLFAGFGVTIAAYRADRRELSAALIGAVAGAAIGVNAIEVLAGPGGSTYYADKLMWLATCIVLVLGALAALSLVTRRSRVPAVVITVVGVTGLVIAAAPLERENYWAQSVPERMLTSGFPYYSEATLVEVLDNADLEKPTVVWNTGLVHEKAVNLWVLRLADKAKPTDLSLREFTYGTADYRSVDYVCAVAGFFSQTLTVETSRESLSDDLEETCPDEDIRVDLL